MKSLKSKESETEITRGKGCSYQNDQARVCQELRVLIRPAGNDRGCQRSVNQHGMQALLRGGDTQNQSLRDELIYRGFNGHGLFG